MINNFLKYLTIITSALILNTEANAYIGPGLGLGALSVIFGIFTVIILGIFGILYFPIKSLYMKIKNQKNSKKKNEKVD